MLQCLMLKSGLRPRKPALSLGKGRYFSAGLSILNAVSQTPPQKQELSLTQSALDDLNNAIATQSFVYPYEKLNLVPMSQSKALAQRFAQQLHKAIGSSAAQPNDTRAMLSDFFRPTMKQVGPIVSSIVAGEYPQELLQHQNLRSEKEALSRVLVDLYYQHYLEAVVLKSPTKQKTANWDITRPADWYPEARKMKRTIIMHVGPTNSGKTHNSLKAFAKAKSGYYAGPLRLLAREIYERFEAQGISCNLITGEEVIPSVDSFGNVSGLSSGTIEMIPLHKKMDICIIDEIQMIADNMRGSAWTNAVLGVQAKEIHLCGEESAVSLIRNLVKATGDELIIKTYSRLGKLTMLKKPVGKLQNLQKGDCVVAFSKRKILELKCMIENTTKLRVGVIYGALPPEIRSQQSSKFNNGEYDILVASDAVGMGLNLRIKRVVFWTTQKFNGIEKTYLTVSATKQIAGRAGRYSADAGESEGFVTAFHMRDLKFLHSKMAQTIPDLKEASIWPPNEFWVDFLCSFRQPTPLAVGVEKFYTSLGNTKMDHFFLSEFEHQMRVIHLINSRDLSDKLTIEDQLQLAQVPFNLRQAEPAVLEQAVKFFRCIADAKSKTVFEMNFLNLQILGNTPSFRNSSDDILNILTELEKSHKLVLVFMWLAQRWPTLFIDKESASEVKTMIEKRISEELDCLRRVNKSRK